MNHAGHLLKQKRAEKKYTLEAVSKFVGVSINYISKLEKGESCNPADEVIVKLARTLGLDEDWLFFAFDKIPLSTKKVLKANPTLAKTISEISGNENFTPRQKEEFLSRTISCYKQVSEK
ncbi:helix-turn-helix domain-containing protein [Bacillus paralicheniformis]|uniref:helix-turn-helix domain-containing protein n=1 Tax=Bacillus paralicheniformis TaxID=1648923 RepID=UPI0034D1CAB7